MDDPIPVGARLGVDLGSVRLGVAGSDPDGTMAYPLETVRRDRARGDDVDRIAALVRERAIVEVVVGLPRSLSGREGRAATEARAWAGALAWRIAPVPVRLVDERLSTVTAQRNMRHSGLSDRRGRALVDQGAAVIILQSALDSVRAGKTPGTVVPPSTRGST
jgi:putative holliday junction resolvase